MHPLDISAQAVSASNDLTWRRDGLIVTPFSGSGASRGAFALSSAVKGRVLSV